MLAHRQGRTTFRAWITEADAAEWDCFTAREAAHGHLSLLLRTDLLGAGTHIVRVSDGYRVTIWACDVSMTPTIDNVRAIG